MESALKESEQRYEAMTSNVPGMVFQLVRKAEGGYAFAYVSQDCEPLTGLPATSCGTMPRPFSRWCPRPIARTSPPPSKPRLASCRLGTGTAACIRRTRRPKSG